MKRSRIKPMSDERASRRKERKDVVAQVAERDGHTCQAQYVWPHECFGPLVGHEPLKRSRGGDIYDAEQVLLVCHFVNSWVEEQPLRAEELGLSVRSGTPWRWSTHWKPLIEGRAS